MAEAADRLMVLARSVARLMPDRRDLERFHLEKSSIMSELRSIAREIGRVPLPLTRRPLAQATSVLKSPSAHSPRPPDCRWCRRRQQAKKRQRLHLRTLDLFTYAKVPLP
jgi:hypothetical protein